jgi:hypothetical protein
MTRTIPATLLTLGLALSMSACGGSGHADGTSAPAGTVSTSESVTTSRTVQVLSEEDDSPKRTMSFTAERGRTTISYKVTAPGPIEILVVDPDGKIIDGMDDKGSGDGSFSLDFTAAGDYALKVTNPKKVPYKISASQHIVD